MIDFTSALYLGLRHPSESLRPWRSYTTGTPAALGEPDEVRAIALALARLLGLAAGALAPSTFHAMWDVFGLLSQLHSSIHMDAGVYPISRWGAAHAALRQAPVQAFRHHDPAALHRHLADDPPDRRPVVVADGFCPACGERAPLSDYLAAVRRRGGWLVIDDTQALGILGRNPSPATPMGRGGGGSLQHANLHGADLIVVASLAKAFGVPLAIVAGSEAFIARFKRGSDTRAHCSPPSAAAVSAAQHALACNDAFGEELRRQLVQRIRQFRDGLAERGIRVSGGLFPVQSLALSDTSATVRLHEGLRQRGINTVLVRGENDRPRLAFLLTARHQPRDIQEAVEAVADLAAPASAALSSDRMQPDRRTATGPSFFSHYPN